MHLGHWLNGLLAFLRHHPQRKPIVRRRQIPPLPKNAEQLESRVLLSASANIDFATVVHDHQLTVTAPGVLSNDYGAQGSPLTASLVSGTSHGTLSLGSNGSYTYKSAANYTGYDYFTYSASDGGGTSNAQVTIWVSNSVPAAYDEYYSTVHDHPLNVSAPGQGLVTSPTDLDGDAVTSVVDTQPSHGTLALNANGTFVYTPAANYVGADSFTYKLFDGIAYSYPATVRVGVTNTIPAALATDYTTIHDHPLNVSVPGHGLATTPIDNDGDAITAVVVTQPSHGTLALNPNGTFVYTPAANYVGADSFTYKLFDGLTYCTPATVTLVVSNAVPAPNDRNFSTVHDHMLSASSPGLVTTPTDNDGDTVTSFVVAQPLHGSLTLNANGSFVYRPNNKFAGNDSFTYRLYDGIAYSAPATVSLAVTNALPVAYGGSYATIHDHDLISQAPGLVSDPFDQNGDPVTSVIVTQPTHGSVELAANGIFTYKPGTKYVGADSFTYKLYDGIAYGNTATVNLTVTNTAPLAANASYWVGRNQTLNASSPGLLDNQFDLDGDRITTTLVTTTTHGSLSLNSDGTFTYTPQDGYTGSDSFTYKQSDGIIDSSTVTVTLLVTADGAPPTGGPSPSPTPTGGPSPSPTPTGGPSPSPTPTGGPSPSPTPTGGPTPTPTPTGTPAPTPTPTPTGTPAPTPTPTPTGTPAPTPTPTPTGTPAPTPTPTPTGTPAPTPTPTPTGTPAPTPTPTPTGTPAPTPTPTPTGTPAPTPTPTPTGTPAPTPTPTPTGTPAPTPTPTPTGTPAPTPTPTPAPAPSPAPTGTLATVDFYNTQNLLPDPGSGIASYPSIEYDATQPANAPLNPVWFRADQAVKAEVTINLPATNTATSVTLRTTWPTGQKDRVDISIPQGATSVVRGISLDLDPTKIQYYEDFKIGFELSFDGGTTWQNIGASHNTIYVTKRFDGIIDTTLTDGLGDSPLSEYRTVVHIATVNAINATTAQDAFDGIWNYFKTLDVNMYGLLEGTTGTCISWSELFIEVNAVHGIDSVLGLSKQHIYAKNTWGPIGRPDILIENVTFGDPKVYTNAPTGYDYEFNDNNVTMRAGAPGQNNTSPQKIFAMHAVVTLPDGTIFDPSYGTQFDNLLDWEDHALAGLVVYYTDPTTGDVMTFIHKRVAGEALTYYSLFP
jgi:hypothetical protein